MNESNPIDWTPSTIGQIVVPKVEQGLRQEEDEFTYVDIGSIDTRTKLITTPKRLSTTDAPSRARQRLKIGDVLVSMTRPNLNSVALVTPELDASIGSTGFSVLRTTDAVVAKWLFYRVQSLDSIEDMTQRVQGALYPAVRRNDIYEFPLKVPPFDEQKQIVAEIETQFARLDDAVAALERARTRLKRYRASVLKAACEGRLVPTEAELAREDGRSYEPASVLLERIAAERAADPAKKRGSVRAVPALDSSQLPDLPEGWSWTTVDELSDVVRGASPRPAGDPKYFGGDIPWITVGSLTADESPYLTETSQFVTELGKEKSRFIEAGTFLLTNSGATLGVPKITLIGGCINDGSVALLSVANKPMKLFLYYFLKTQTKRLRAINQGAAQPNLNTSIVRAITIPIPPAAEQERIVAEVERVMSFIEQLEATVDTNLKRTESLRQSILRLAFSGRLVTPSAGGIDNARA